MPEKPCLKKKDPLVESYLLRQVSILIMFLGRVEGLLDVVDTIDPTQAILLIKGFVTKAKQELSNLQKTPHI